MNLDDIYTPIEEAKEEIWRRWDDKELEKKVEKFLRHDIPDFLVDGPKAYLARHVASLNFEFLRFMDLANNIGMKFATIECLDDKYISTNSLKRLLGKMFFYTGTNKNGDNVCVSQKVIDFDNSEGKCIKDIETVVGKKLVDLHHDILCEEFPHIRSTIKDISRWVNANGKTPDVFYPRFLAFFLRNGILFENFLLNKEEKKLTENIIIPAVVMLKKEFGLKPLIVGLLPKETEDDQSWYHYNEHIRNYIWPK